MAANKIIKEISKYAKIWSKFITYITDNIDHIKTTTNVKIFLNDYEFVLQLGVIKSFLEDEYNIGLHADKYSWIVYYIEAKEGLAKSLFKDKSTYVILEKYYNITKEKKESIFDNYGESIIEALKYIQDNIETSPF